MKKFTVDEFDLIGAIGVGILGLILGLTILYA